jgi:rRNA maturation protein Nop10
LQTAVSCGSQLISILPIHFVFQTAVNCGENQRISIPPMHVVCQTAVSCGESQLISIPPKHVVCQTTGSCGGSQLIGRETRVANLGDFSPKNANLGNYRNREIFRGI